MEIETLLRGDVVMARVVLKTHVGSGGSSAEIESDFERSCAVRAVDVGEWEYLRTIDQGIRCLKRVRASLKRLRSLLRRMGPGIKEVTEMVRGLEVPRRMIRREARMDAMMVESVGYMSYSERIEVNTESGRSCSGKVMHENRYAGRASRRMRRCRWVLSLAVESLESG
jgi:hypothetical protein